MNKRLRAKMHEKEKWQKCKEVEKTKCAKGRKDKSKMSKI